MTIDDLTLDTIAFAPMTGTAHGRRPCDMNMRRRRSTGIDRRKPFGSCATTQPERTVTLREQCQP